MFGYIKACQGELKVSENDIYKGAYCALCKALGKNYGQISRLTLNYDIAFMTVMLLSVSDEEIYLKQKRCGLKLKSTPCLTFDNSVFRYSCAVAMLMNYYKIIDNIDDRKGLKRLAFYLALPYFKIKKRKAARSYPHIAEAMEKMYKNQAAAQENPSADIDSASHPTAQMLGEVFSSGAEDYKQEFYRIGYCIGKWVYLMDAVDDLEEDRKSESFNPLFSDCDIGRDADMKKIRSVLEPVLRNCVSEAYISYKKTKPKRYGGIIENVLTLGLEQTKEKIFSGSNVNE